MRPYRGLDEAAPEPRVSTRRAESQAGGRGDEAGVESQQFRARAPVPDRVAELLETGHQASATEQIEIVSQGGRVARVLELPDHLLVGEDLPRVLAPHPEHLAQQGRFVHPGQQEDVARDGGLDQ